MFLFSKREVSKQILPTPLLMDITHISRSNKLTYGAHFRENTHPCRTYFLQSQMPLRNKSPLLASKHLRNLDKSNYPVCNLMKRYNRITHDELTRLTRWEERNLNFFCYSTVECSISFAVLQFKKQKMQSLSLCLSPSLSLHYVSVSVKDLNTTYLKLSLCITSSNTFWHRMVDWDALASAHRLFIQTALLARDAIIYPHYSILPLNVTINLQSSTYYMLLYTSNARKKKPNG